MGSASRQLGIDGKAGLPDNAIELGAKFVLKEVSDGVVRYRAFPGDRFTAMELEVNPEKKSVTVIGKIYFPDGFSREQAEDITTSIIRNANTPHSTPPYDIATDTVIDLPPSVVTISISSDGTTDDGTTDDDTVSAMVRYTNVSLTRVGWEIWDRSVLRKEEFSGSHTLLTHAASMLRLYGRSSHP